MSNSSEEHTRFSYDSSNVFLPTHNKLLKFGKSDFSSRRMSSTISEIVTQVEEETNKTRTITLNDPMEELASIKIVKHLRLFNGMKAYWRVKSLLKNMQKDLDYRFLIKIVPNINDVFKDTNNGTKVIFRLAGESWPPKILYKIIIVGLKSFEFINIKKDPISDNFSNKINFRKNDFLNKLLNYKPIEKICN